MAEHWRALLQRTVGSWTPDVLLVNPVKGAPGTRGTEASVAPYADTVAPSYLYGKFHHTFPAEPFYFNMIAAELRRAGITCEIADGFCHRFDSHDILGVINSFKPRIIAFAVFHNTVADALYCARQIKMRTPAIPIVIGSAYASPHWQELVNDPAVDFVVVGDGEIAFRALAEAILAGSPTASLPGIASMRDGVPVLAPPIPVQALDDLAFATRDLLPIIFDDQHSAAMYTTRGCAFGKCTFCYLLPYQAVSLQPRWRARSPKNVVDEIEHLTANYGVSRITFVDEDYFGNNSDGVARAVAIAELILARGIKVQYYVNALVKSLLFVKRQGLLPLLSRSGLDSVFAGFESSSRETLLAFHKPQRPSQYDEVISGLLEHGIRLSPGLISFTPTSTLEDIRGNVSLAERMQYYDLYLFTRRLVDLEKPMVEARAAAMEKPSADDGWLEAYRREHDETHASFVDKRVATLYEMMRVLCNLLFESLRAQCARNPSNVKHRRDEFIRRHYETFYRALAFAQQAPTEGLDFDEIEAWARQAYTAVMRALDCNSEADIPEPIPNTVALAAGWS